MLRARARCEGLPIGSGASSYINRGILQESRRCTHNISASDMTTISGNSRPTVFKLTLDILEIPKIVRTELSGPRSSCCKNSHQANGHSLACARVQQDSEPAACTCDHSCSTHNSLMAHILRVDLFAPSLDRVWLQVMPATSTHPM